jgi:mRNA-degrading endonuclease RelE of RelBE toxin-antitoxin system
MVGYESEAVYKLHVMTAAEKSLEKLPKEPRLKIAKKLKR